MGELKCYVYALGLGGLTSGCPPPHLSVVATPAWTAEGKVVNAIFDCARVAPMKEAPSRKVVANCMLAMFLFSAAWN